MDGKDIDLKVAYFLVPMISDHQKFLQFQHLSVSLPSIQPVLCSPGIYKDDEASSDLPKRERHQTNNLSGRYHGVLQQPGDHTRSTEIDEGLVSVLGPYHQFQEVPIGTQDKTASQGATLQDRSLCTEVSCICGYDSGSKASDSSEPPLPLELAGSDKQNVANGKFTGRSETELPSNGRNFSRGQTGVGMVGSGSPGIQCHSTGNTSTRGDNRVRCLLSGLGGNSEGPGIDNRELWSVTRRAGTSTILEGHIHNP